jgi:hypothetical protein
MRRKCTGKDTAHFLQTYSGVLILAVSEERRRSNHVVLWPNLAGVKETLWCVFGKTDVESRREVCWTDSHPRISQF